MKGSLKIRRGLAVLYLLGGLIHAATMLLATLYSLGRVPLDIRAGLWSELYYAHFLFMVLGGGAYLALTFRSDGLFYAENMLDYAVGIAAFTVLVSVSAVLLVNRMANPWTSLIPSLFLLAYAAGLWTGRTMGFGPKA